MENDLFRKLSHDLQGPLTVIQGFLRLMGQSVSLDEDQKALLEASRLSLNKIKDLLQEHT